MKDLWLVQFGTEDAALSTTSFTKEHTAQRATIDAGNRGAVAFKRLPVKLGEIVMNRISRILLTCGLLVFACVVACAQNIQGVINRRSGPTMTVQSDSGNVTVLLNEDTTVEDVSGLFHAHKKDMGVTVLVPGLAVQVQGTYNAQNQLVANTVKFNSKSLETATDIQAGMTPVEQQAQSQQQEIRQQQAELAQEQKVQQEHAEEIAANKSAIVAVNKRFGELGDYNIWDEVTVLFGNGMVNIEPEYDPKLQALAKKAVTVTGYVIQVQGYASKIGSAALNQTLSQERAQNVIEYLEQKCGIPMTNMLAPGAMGTSRQVAPDNTTEGQADNRRVVVRVLQNKGIAGT
jgi:outer membrane protein OmpA-like peptidoglycan-associated protein